VNVTALIPAHNEAEWIGKVIINLKDQTRPPSRIIVVSDNSTDATISLAAAAGAEVQVSVDNTHKKAGALNQALGRILPDLDDTDFIFIQDADTLPAPHWLEVGLAWAAGQPGAVISGRYASPPTGWSIGSRDRQPAILHHATKRRPRGRIFHRHLRQQRHRRH
jgi:biofilm PGA synthesis N-glycosyltransferase PgaC